MTDHFNTVDKDGNLRTPAEDEIEPGTVSSEYHDKSGNKILGARVASGSVTLSSGEATVDLGIPSTETASFMIAIGAVTTDAWVGADIKAAGGGNHTVRIQETTTSIGNPTVEYDIVRVR